MKENLKPTVQILQFLKPTVALKGKLHQCKPLKCTTTIKKAKNIMKKYFSKNSRLGNKKIYISRNKNIKKL